MRMSFFLATKAGMTQLFTDDGRAVPVTALAVAPMTVVALRTPERDGYAAVQVGFGEQKPQRLSRSVLGHTKGKAFRWLVEFRVAAEALAQFSVGQELTAADLVPEGAEVTVVGTSKGKGFQGVVKRWGFKGGPKSHGQAHNLRAPGSIGGGLRARVPKGMRMAGRMGGDRVSVRNVQVLRYDPSGAVAYVKGSVPGTRGSLVRVEALIAE